MNSGLRGESPATSHMSMACNMIFMNTRVLNFGPYLTENAARLHYEHQPVNAY